MKMYRKPATLAIALFVFSSFCPPANDGLLRLRKLRSETSTNSHTIDFEYNSAGNISTVAIRDSSRLHTPLASGGLIYIRYEYSPDQRVKKEITKYTYTTSTGIYQYNADKTIKRIDYTFTGKEEPIYTEYVWDHGRIQEIRCVQTKGNAPFSALYCQYDASGNLSQVQFDNFKGGGRQVFYSSITSDNKYNYMSAIPGLSNPYGVFYADPNIFSQHNITNYHYTFLSANQYFYSSFDYNDKGYPVRQVFTDKSTPTKMFYYK